MDPLSALGVAAGVVQFIDFGTRLTSVAGQLYLSPSGRTADEVELSTIASDLSQVSANIKSETNRLAQGAPTVGTSEAALFTICEESVAAAKKLEDASKISSTPFNQGFVSPILGCRESVLSEDEAAESFEALSSQPLLICNDNLQAPAVPTAPKLLSYTSLPELVAPSEGKESMP